MPRNDFVHHEGDFDGRRRQVADAVERAGPGARAAAVTTAAARALPGIDAAVITLYGRSSRCHVAASHPWAEEAEELQWVTGEGPSESARHHRMPVLVPRLATGGTAWPTFREAACRLGVTGVFAFPLHAGTSMLGTLTFYRRRHGEHAPSVAGPMVTDARPFTDMATEVLLDDVDDEIIDRITSDTDTDAVSTAVGFLAAEHGSTTEDALVRLRGAAYARGCRMADAARDVLARRLGDLGR